MRWCLLLLVALTGCGTRYHTRAVSANLSLTPPMSFVVNHEQGDITVQRGSVPMVRAEVRARSAERALSVTVNAQRRDDAVHVTLVWPGGRRADESARLTLEVPVAETLHVHTRSGRIDIFNVGQDVVGRTTAGSIIVNGAAGAVDVETSAGDIAVTEAGGPVTAVSGEGHLRATFAPQGRGPITMTTQRGNIHVGLSEAMTGRLTAISRSGIVTAGEGIPIIEQTRRQTIVQVGEQESNLGALETRGGSIRIERR